MKRFQQRQAVGEILSVLIFIGLGIYMICKARNNKQIFERRNDEINWKRLRKLAVLTSVDALFAGMGIGFWSVEILEQGWYCFRLRSFSVFLAWRLDTDWAVNITARVLLDWRDAVPDRRSRYGGYTIFYFR